MEMLSNTLSIKSLDETSVLRWDAFVYQATDSSFFHLSAWQQVIEEAFGHRCYYCYAERDGEIIGILPLTHIKSVLFGNSLISTPFCVYGGIIASDVKAR